MENDEEVRLEYSVNGGTDVMSCSSDSISSADHLIVMVHGILGSTTDWQYGANQFVKMLPDKVIVHCSECNMRRLTLDGVDVMGERLAEEVVAVIGRIPGLRKVSFIAHSVGGLVARYAIGRLYRPPSGEQPKDPSDDAHVGGESDVNSRGTISGLEAVNFITVATPHLGSRGNRQVPFLFGLTAIEKVAASVIHWIFRRTGKHLFLTDNDEGQPPLLKRMVDDHGSLYFMSALRAFRRRVAYANVGYDHIVGWRTSSIRCNPELPMWEGSVSEEYPHVVYEERTKGVNVDTGEQASTKGVNVDTGERASNVTVDSDVLEEELVTALSRVSWEKVDVSFHSSRQKYAAHSLIQVKFPFMESEGADVIKHMINHFLT